MEAYEQLTVPAGVLLSFALGTSWVANALLSVGDFVLGFVHGLFTVIM